jgi:hypothetical protein
MHKMLVILGSFALAGAAWASDVPDRSALSYEENAIINQACSPALQQSVSAFHACVARQVASLKDHPTPDRSGLSVARNRAIENGCSYLKREGIGPYNDCVRKAMTVAEKPSDNPNVDDLVPNYTKVFTDDATKAADAPAAPKPTPAAATALPSPAAALPKRPDHLEQKPLSPEEIYKKVERSVFVVLASPSLAEVKVRNIAQGSAIAVSDHLLLTNCHVVKDRPLIKLWQDGTRADATLVAADDKTDRCVIKTDELTLKPIGGVRPLDSLAVGEHVFAIGAPISLERTLSEGLISGLRPGRARHLVQTSAPISPGSSGGGLFDERGNLVGITTAGFMGGAQNLNFAIAAADWWQ